MKTMHCSRMEYFFLRAKNSTAVSKQDKMALQVPKRYWGEYVASEINAKKTYENEILNGDDGEECDEDENRFDVQSQPLLDKEIQNVERSLLAEVGKIISTVLPVDDYYYQNYYYQNLLSASTPLIRRSRRLYVLQFKR